MALIEGNTFIPGRSRAVAQQLIAGAKELGLDVKLILTRRDGYEVPSELAEHVAGQEFEEQEGPEIDLTDLRGTPYAPIDPANEKKGKKTKVSAPVESDEDKAKREATEAAETARIEQERLDKEKADAEKAEQERLEAEKAAAEAKEKADAEKAAAAKTTPAKSK